MLKKTLLLLMLIAVFGAVYAQEGEPATGEPIRVGAVFDLSGATGDVGTPYANGVIAYVDWRNQNGGINGRPIELLSADYAYSVETAENLYSQFVSEGAVVFMGWGTGDTIALVSKVAEDEIPFISASYSATLNDPQGTAPYNFLIATTYSDQLVILMRHMLDLWTESGQDPADMNVAIFHNDSPFGTDPVADGTAYAEEAGIGGVLAIPMPRGATDFTAELTQADNFGVTHIIVQNVSSPAALLASNAEEFFGGLNGEGEVQFGCLNWCADELFVSQAGEASEGTLGAIPFTPTTVEIEGQAEPRAYLEAQGQTLEEASLHFTQGWAAMDVMAQALQRTLDAGLELTGPNIRDTMQQMENVETGGILAPITFSEEDHRGNRALAIYRVEDGVWVESSEVIDLRAEEMGEAAEETPEAGS
jgi:branched-chain amino acid transport system substrate-binding protein